MYSEKRKCLSADNKSVHNQIITHVSADQLISWLTDLNKIDGINTTTSIVSVNKILYKDTVSVNKILHTDTVSVNKTFLYRYSICK